MKLPDFTKFRPLEETRERMQAELTDKLEAARETILQNRRMVDLDCHLDLPVPIDDLRITPDYPRMIEAMEKCEFKSLLQEARDEAVRAGTQTQGELLL